MHTKKISHLLPVLLGMLLLSALLSAQQAAVSTSSVAAVPRLVNFSGKAIDAEGKAIPGVAGITFAIYGEQYGGSPLWIETQSVKTDAKGNYTAQLGATKTDGMPLDLFSTSAPRWLGARVNGGEEQARVLLLSVPYALKAEDAATLGGLPASAFMLAAAPVSGAVAAADSSTLAVPPPATVTGSGTADFVPLWTGTSVLTNSILFQSGSGSSAKIGINQTSPAATLDIGGGATVRGLLNLPAAAAATSAAGADSRPFGLVASSYNSGTKASTNQVFHWQAEPAANNTASPSATLNLLFAVAPATAAETGLRINSKGQITFASGQTFPGTGTGTVTSVGLSAPSSDFSVSGSPVTGSGTLALNWNTAPTSSDTANAIVKRDSTGSFSAGSITSTSSTSSGTAITATTATGVGVYGQATSDGYGIIGQSSSGYGLYGESSSFPGVGGISGSNYAIYGLSESNHGVVGQTLSASAYGVYGVNSETGGIGVYGLGSTGVVGVSNTGGSGVYAQSGDNGWAVNAYNAGDSTGVLAGSVSGYAAWFNGDVNVDGNLSKNGGSFKIDHPLDPANKYLYHSFVESPDMMNIYNGNAITDAKGEAVVTLPEWFETLNRDFRYQLTVMGQFAQAIVSGKVANHQFSIKTDKPNVEVSWQVTGIRQDVWANAHRIPVEEVKPELERGFYQHPELYNAPAEKSILWARYPQAMKQWKAARTAKLATVAHGPLVKASAPAKP
jgi:trimeric autotransporter adhesin